MAETDSNTEVINNSLTAPWRHDLALEATYEIDAMARLLIKHIKHIEPSSCFDNELFAFKGIAMRIIDLNSVAMSAISDPGETAEDLERRLG